MGKVIALKLVADHRPGAPVTRINTEAKKAATSVRWVGQSLHHQVREIYRFQSTMGAFEEKFANLDKTCQKYLRELERIDVRRLNRKSLRLARIAGGWR